MPTLSLAHFTVIDADPITLIEVGAAAGFDAVGLRIVPPPGAAAIVEVVGDMPLQRRIKQRLAATGVALLDVEAIWLLPETDVGAMGAVLDTGADLGARHLLLCGNDPERNRMVATLGQLAEMAQQRGLRPIVEFLPYTTVRTLAEAHALLVDAGVEGGGVLVDALHLSRSGGSPADLAGYDPALFPYYHLCDAPAALPAPEDLRTEARGGRLYPGEGALWLREFVAAFPPDTPAAIEAPSYRHAAAPPMERARLAAASCRTLLERLHGGGTAST